MVPGMTLPASLLLVLQVTRPCFTKHSFETFCHLVAGMVAQTGRRTVTGMLMGAGLSRLWPHRRAHAFFSEASWDPDQLGLRLARAVVEALLPADETVDGMSLGKIGRIIDALRYERYRFKPARRTYIPKRNGKKRPLGIPSWSDKLVGEVVRLLLEAYYEPQFSDRSHGFRPNRGCHTALSEVANQWTGTTWFIESDIADCFGSIDHGILLSILAEKIHDRRFLRLLQNMLRAGYLEDWVWHATLSGAPQGGVASPVLSNIYLHRLDSFIEDVLIPEYTRGKGRVLNPEYRKVDLAIRRAHRRGDRVTVRALRKQLRSLPSRDPADPGFRRLRYVRYCDDHLLGFTGPKFEAEEIKERLAKFLRAELKLELSQEKTLITHARTGAARFLANIQRDRRV